MKIRLAHKDDVSLLQRLNDEVFMGVKEFDDDVIDNWARGEKGRSYFTNLLNNPDGCCLIAEDSENPVGYITATPKTDIYRKSKILELENMGVIPKYRSRGIGAELVKKLLLWGKDKGFQKIYVGVYFDNTKAIGFYKKNGFKEIDLGLERNI